MVGNGGREVDWFVSIADILGNERKNAMAKRKHKSKKEQNTNASSLMMVGGFTLLGVALVLLLFGSNILGNTIAAEERDQVPALQNTTLPVAEGNGRLPQIGDDLAEFASRDLDGNTIRLSDYQGQPVMVNFWATWCPPCRMELPDFQTAYDTHKGDGLVILAVNQDESEELIRSFFYDTNGFTFTPVLDEGSQISRSYGINSFPTTIFVNAEGVVTAVHQGLLFPEQLEVYLAQTIPSQG